MSKDGRLFKDILEVNAAVDIARTRAAQEKQLKIVQDQAYEESAARRDAQKLVEERNEAEDEEKKKVRQLAAIEKIHQLDLKIHCDQMVYVEEIALAGSIPLKVAAEKFRQRVIGCGAALCLPENRETMDDELVSLARKYDVPVYEVEWDLEYTIKESGGVSLQARLEKRSADKRKAEAETQKQEGQQALQLLKSKLGKHRALRVLAGFLTFVFGFYLLCGLMGQAAIVVMIGLCGTMLSGWWFASCHRKSTGLFQELRTKSAKYASPLIPSRKL